MSNQLLEIIKQLESIPVDIPNKLKVKADEDRNEEVILYLMKNNKGLFVWDLGWAAARGYVNVVKYLHPSGISDHCMKNALFNDRLDVVEYLLSLSKYNISSILSYTKDGSEAKTYLQNRLKYKEILSGIENYNRSPKDGNKYDDIIELIKKAKAEDRHITVIIIEN